MDDVIAFISVIGLLIAVGFAAGVATDTIGYSNERFVKQHIETPYCVTAEAAGIRHEHCFVALEVPAGSRGAPK